MATSCRAPRGAAHRASLGWSAQFVTLNDRVALVLTTGRRRSPSARALADQQIHRRWLPGRRWLGSATVGGTHLAVDPVLDADARYESALAAGGFAETEEIQPSRHRLVLRFSRVTTSAIQARIRQEHASAHPRG